MIHILIFNLLIFLMILILVGIFAPGTRNRIVTISGSRNSVNTAQYLIEQQLNEEEAKRRQNAPALNSVLH